MDFQLGQQLKTEGSLKENESEVDKPVGCELYGLPHGSNVRPTTISSEESVGMLNRGSRIINWTKGLPKAAKHTLAIGHPRVTCTTAANRKVIEHKRYI